MQPLPHLFHFMVGNVQGKRCGMNIVCIIPSQAANGVFGFAQLEEKLALGLGRTDFEQTPGGNNMVLDIRPDPPDRIGDKPDTLVRVELSDRHHQPDITLLDQIEHLDTVMTEF